MSDRILIVSNNPYPSIVKQIADISCHVTLHAGVYSRISLNENYTYISSFGKGNIRDNWDLQTKRKDLSLKNK